MMPVSIVPRSSLRRRISTVCMSAAIMLGLVVLLQEPLTGLGAGSQQARLAFVESKSAGPGDGKFANLPRGEAAVQLQQQLLTAGDRSHRALQLFTSLLQDARQRLEKTSDYSASFVVQERLENGELQERQNTELKVRHAPFSLYMKWLEGGDVGREIVYMEGQHDNRAFLHLGGVKGRLLPTLKLNPSGSLAMQQSRYPVTDMGLLNLTLKIIDLRQQDLARDKGVHWQLLPNQSCSGRDCLCLLVEYDSPEFSTPIRKSLTYIDKELSLPICVKSYTWPEAGCQLQGDPLDEATLIEFYEYTNVRFNPGLKDYDFDRTNEEYAFNK